MKAIRIVLMLLIVSLSITNAKEPTNWFVGAGIGAGLSQIDVTYPDAAKNKLGVTWLNWTHTSNTTVKDWGVNWELILGYKHWVNDWIGFRYYLNAGMQHYKQEIFSAGKVNADIVDYMANAEILINFYTNEKFSVGMFGGLGVGGASFSSKALDAYKSKWYNKAPNTGLNTETNPPGMTGNVYEGEGNIYKHHLSASAQVGLRFSYFQKIRDIDSRSCKEESGGRQVCRVPVHYFEHGLEFIAKFPLTNYKVTDPADILGAYSNGVTGYPATTGKYISIYKRPGYIVANPFKFNIRYVFAF